MTTNPTPEPVDDHVAAWIKAARDRQNPDGTAWDLGRWNVLDDLLEDWRLHADTGTPIDQHACEGPYCCGEFGEEAPSAEAGAPEPARLDEIIRAPFDEAQVAELNDWQQRTDVHPFTCPNRGDGRHDGEGVLVAYSDGWLCRNCDYMQNWAHGSMSDIARPGSVTTTPDPAALAAAARNVLAEWSRMHPSGYLAMYPAMDALRAAVAAPRVEPAPTPAALALIDDLLRPWAYGYPVNPGYAGRAAQHVSVETLAGWNARRAALASTATPRKEEA